MKSRKPKMDPNLIQSLIIYDTFPIFPRIRYNTPNQREFLAQKEIIKICSLTGMFNVKPSKYDGKKKAHIGEIEDERQVFSLSFPAYEVSREKIGNLSNDELRVLRMACHGLKDWKYLEKEGLEERISIMIEGSNIDNKNISPEFVEKIYWEIKKSYWLENYF